MQLVIRHIGQNELHRAVFNTGYRFWAGKLSMDDRKEMVRQVAILPNLGVISETFDSVFNRDNVSVSGLGFFGIQIATKNSRLLFHRSLDQFSLLDLAIGESSCPALDCR